MTKSEMMKQARDRVKAISFGDPITNVCAGDKNPTKRAFFVSASRGEVECTDKNGKFWDVCIEVIYPGHLPDDECDRIFAPIHEAIYGKTVEAQQCQK